MKDKVFIVCSGVGHVNRGYESFTRECFDTLKDETAFDLYMLKGGGKSGGREIKVNCIQRNSASAKRLAKLLKVEPYWIEQLTFFFGMLPTLFKYRPKVIFYSDFILGTFLWHFRKRIDLKYKLLFSNGAPNGPPYKTEDHVQQLLPLYLAAAIKQNEPVEKQTVLPYAIDIKDIDLTETGISALRKELSLPLDKKIIVSVGAVNSDHKRMHYVVDEFSKISSPNYYLVILGQIDEKSEEIFSLAKEKLKADSYIIKQVPGDAVAKYMAASDYFILASLKEGLPRVLPEALSNGLLPIVHDYNVTRETLGDYGAFYDLTKDEVLLKAVEDVDKRGLSKAEIRQYARDTYSWENLRSGYVSMITKVMNS